MLVLFVLLYLKYCFCTQIDYCQLCESHTMCKYRENPKDSCANYGSIQMDLHLQGMIVNTHNKLRSNVALGLEKRKKHFLPPAANMLGLVWDNELATISQRWADACTVFKSDGLHDTCRKTERFEVGQNVFNLIVNVNTTIQPNFVTMILNWYNEIDKMEEFDPKEYVTNNQENFTQIIWAETRYIGCGHASFLHEIDGSPHIIHKFVCNYGPSGNVRGKSIYDIGDPCSKCKSNFICDTHYPGLCFAKNVLETENRIRELVQSVNDLVKQRSIDRMKYTKRDNKTISKINEFSYTDVIVDYLAKALDYHKEHLNELTTNERQNSDEVFANMKDFQNKTLNKVVVSEFGLERNLPYQPNGYIVKESDYTKVDGIWNDGLCRCNYIFRSSASSVKSNVILLLFFFFVYYPSFFFLTL